MTFATTLIAVRDMTESLKFYKELFDQDVVMDLGWNKTLSCGLTLQEHFDRIAGFDESTMQFHTNNMELYFETEDFEAFLQVLDQHPEVKRLHDVRQFEWLQRGIHIYDPDGHLLEVSESMYSVACKQFEQGYDVSETARRIQHPEDVVQGWFNQWKTGSYPDMSNGRFIIRPTKKEDASQLLRVYSDPAAVPFFNSDNCHGDDFFYQTQERMEQAVDFWLESCRQGWFTRWTIADRTSDEAVGTIEAFKRESDDYFTDCVLLRLDVRSDYEKAAVIACILQSVQEPLCQHYRCRKIVTKGFPESLQRLEALKALGYQKRDEPLIGQYDTYHNYWELCI